MSNWKMGLAAAALMMAAGGVQADVIDDWNEQWLDTIRVVGGPPCPIARNGAILFAAMYDAVNSIDPKNEPYIGFVNVPGPAVKRVAAAAAAHKVLTTLYPARQAVYDAQYQANLAGVPNAPSKFNGIAVGLAAADQILAARADDRTDTEPVYVYEDKPGAYRPTPPDFTEPPFNPGWGTTKPWTMAAGNTFRPTGPFGFRRVEKLLASNKYRKQYNEVKRLGERNSTHRSPEQTEIAWFWANDRDGTFKPPGQLLHITQVVANQQGLSLDEKAHLFGLVAIAMADAGLVAWDMKYATNIDLWRPVSAVREADTDNNPGTIEDPNWLPLLEFSPPFPAYTSGHATFGAAHAAVMRNYFRTDDITFTVGTDEPIVSSVTRTFNSFTEAARENGLSRVYLGVHFRCDADIGFSTGTLLGNYVFNNHMQPLTCRADINKDGRINARDITLYTDAFFGGNVSIADMNGDSSIDYADFHIYVNLYFADCTPGQ